MNNAPKNSKLNKPNKSRKNPINKKPRRGNRYAGRPGRKNAQKEVYARALARNIKKSQPLNRDYIPGCANSEDCAGYLATVSDPYHVSDIRDAPSMFPVKASKKKFQYAFTFTTNATGYFYVYVNPWDIASGPILCVDSTLSSTGTTAGTLTTPVLVSTKFPSTAFNSFKVIGASLRANIVAPPGTTTGYTISSNMAFNPANATSLFTENQMRDQGSFRRNQPYETAEVIYYPRDADDLEFYGTAPASQISQHCLTLAGYGVLTGSSTNSPVTVECVYTLIVAYQNSLTNYLSEMTDNPSDMRALSSLNEFGKKRPDFSVSVGESSPNWVQKMYNKISDFTNSAPAKAIGNALHDIWDSGAIGIIGKAAMAMI